MFYEGNEFYANHPEKAIVVAGGYSDEIYAFSMRPIGAPLAIPKNHLVVVTHQYQPWAKQIYDVVSIVAALPNFAPLTQENAESLMKGVSPDRLSITLGSLAADPSSAQHREAVQNGTLVPDARRSSLDVPAFRKSIDTAGTEPYFALPDPSKFKSPLGNAVVITCHPHAQASRESEPSGGTCTVQTALPPSYFPRARTESFGGVAGVRLYYQFNEKHLSQWSEWHPRLLAFLRGFIQ